MHEQTWEPGGAERTAIRKWLFNPFHYVAGAKALVTGLFFLIFTGVFGCIGRTRFDGLLDFHLGLPPLAIWGYVSENLVSWALLSTLLVLAGKLISKSKPRLIDVFGTQALARFPYLLVSIAALIPGANLYLNALLNGRVLWNQFSLGMAAFLFVVFFGLLMLVWMVALMYRAFAVSCNVSGKVAVTVFVVALIVGEILSKIFIYRLFPIVMAA